MSSYLLFIPGDREPSDVDALHGLSREGDLATTPVDVDGPGPGGHPGRLWAFNDGSSSVPHLVYKRDQPESQLWREGPGFWLGIDPQNPPTPDVLQRRGLRRRNAEKPDELPFAGHGVKMADGQVWEIPNAMLLPFSFQPDATGAWKKVRQAADESIYTRTVWAFELALKLAAELTPIDESNCGEVAAYVGEMLSLNYRGTAAVFGLLGLFDNSTLWQALANTTDVDELNRMIEAASEDREKKLLAELESEDSAETSAGPNTACGESVTSDANQPLAMSS